MPIPPETVASLCEQISCEVRDYQKNLTLYFIVYRTGGQRKAFSGAARDLMGHPAAEQALRFLQNKGEADMSSLLGTCAGKQNIFMGLGAHHSVLSLCAVNADDFESLNEVRTKGYHFAWHALEAAAGCSDSIARTFNKQMSAVRPKSASAERAAANFRADIFSAIVASLHNDKDAARRVALKRVREALTAKPGKYPEYYPFPVALDAVLFALSQTEGRQVARKKIIPAALKMTGDIVRAFDETVSQNWESFAVPAQEMAWCGAREEEILSAALNTSPDTFVRATGYQAAEIAGIRPGSVFGGQERYSSYAPAQINLKAHDRMVTQHFTSAIEAALRTGHSLAFFDLAAEQNERLAQGYVAGWCAAALQAGGALFDALEEKNPSRKATLVRKEMEKQRDAVKWESLLAVSRRIIRDRREGRLIALEDVPSFARGTDGLNGLLKSVEKTLGETGYDARKSSASVKSGPTGIYEMSSRL